jgi:ATP-independent RNA helicase DbpA
VAARGLDIAQLEAVINVDVSDDIQQHVHRVGRTGRAGEEGWAFSLASLDDMGRVGQVEAAMGFVSEWHPLSELTPTGSGPLQAPMVTLQILGGRKDKVRPGDVLGALTGEAKLTAAQVGKINVTEVFTYVAVAREVAGAALQRLQNGQIKGRKMKLRFLNDA